MSRASEIGIGLCYEPRPSARRLPARRVAQNLARSARFCGGGTIKVVPQVPKNSALRAEFFHPEKILGPPYGFSVFKDLYLGS